MKQEAGEGGNTSSNGSQVGFFLFPEARLSPPGILKNRNAVTEAMHLKSTIHHSCHRAVIFINNSENIL